MLRRRPIVPSALVLASTLVLTGCFPRPDYSGIPGMSSLTVSAREDVIPLEDAVGVADPRRARLAAFLGATPGAVPRFRVEVPPGADAQMLREQAIALGAAPERLSVVTAAAGSVPALRVIASTVAAPDCSSMLLPSSHVQHDSRATFAFGCATRSNLAAMLDDPADLVAPVPFAGATASRETAAVRRYLKDQTKPLLKTTVVQKQ